MKAKIFATAAALMLAAFSANAAPYTLDLTGSNSAGTGFGNVRSYNIGGITVTASAWSLTGSSGTSFQTSQLGRYTTGLGVCNQIEGKNCNSPEHQADNVGSYDFVLFQFSAAVDPTSVRIDPAAYYDRDVSYWTGTATNPLNLTGETLNTLAALGFGTRMDDNASASSNARNVSITSGLANSLLFGASVLDPRDRDDWFKITSIKFDYTPPTQVPEPGSLALLALALGGLGLARRRRAA